MPICPKCHKLISANHYERHLRRCGTSHHHQPQSLYVPSATAQIESPNRGITYGPPSSSHGRRTDLKKWRTVGLVIMLLLGIFIVFYVVLGLSLV
jgi:hypothetical protein